MALRLITPVTYPGVAESLPLYELIAVGRKVRIGAGAQFIEVHALSLPAVGKTD